MWCNKTLALFDLLLPIWRTCSHGGGTGGLSWAHNIFLVFVNYITGTFTLSLGLPRSKESCDGVACTLHYVFNHRELTPPFVLRFHLFLRSNTCKWSSFVENQSTAA